MTKQDPIAFDDATDLAASVPREHLPSGSFVVSATSGPAAGARVTLDAATPSLLAGQGPACALRLADRLVSRRHMSLEVVDGMLRVTDLGSRNGTFVNGVRVVEASLQGTESIRLGETTLTVRLDQATPAAEVPLGSSFGRMLGASLAMRRLHPMLSRLVASDVPVIIEGETGTGKEVLAEALHELGPRSAGPYIVFDCTSVPASLVEAELFGYERGAFTGASAAREGLFEAAHKGTLLIDEIGDLDASMQPKLLRAVERGEIRRIGGRAPIKVDVRLLAATRRNLDEEVQQGRFRDDLFHRLAVARVELPPLRRRAGDVRLLVEHFWSALGGDAAGPPPELLARWESHAWPGNVRELRNAVARAIALGDTLRPETDRGHDRPADPPARTGDRVEDVLRRGLPFTQARDVVMDDFVARFVAHVLAQHGGDTARAAAASGIARRYFNQLRARVAR
jgi:DNA-binding NtrC family response regulator